MLNQELTDYVKKCLEQGMGKEAIRKTLIQTGWQVGEVEAVLSSFGGSVLKKSNLKLILGLGLLVLILAGGGFYWWQKSVKKNDDSTKNLPVAKVQNELSTMEKYIASYVEKYKANKPEATESELSEFSSKIRQDISSEADNLLAACKGLPTLINSSTLSGKQLPENFGLGPVLVVDKAKTEIYAQTGFGEGCLYRTIDSGITWKILSSQDDVLAYLSKLEKIASDSETCNDIPENVSLTNIGFDGESVYSVAIVSEKSPEIYAQIRGSCIYYSADAGSNWTRVIISKGGPSAYDFNLSVNPNDSNHLYVSKNLESFDGGKTWSAIKVREPDVSEIVQDNIRKVKTINSVVQGITVSPVNKALYALTTEDISVQWDDKGKLATNASNGTSSIYKSEDNGKNWKKVYEFSRVGMKSSNCSYSYITTDRKTPDVVYAACDNLYRSADAGKTWSLVLKSDDSKKQYIPASLVANGDLIYGVNPASGIELFFRSVDNGKTWVIKKTGFHIYQIATSQLDDTIIFVTDFDGNVYVSKNSGDSWNKIVLPVKLETYDTISGISFHDSSKTLFLATNKGLYRIPIQ